MKIVFIAANVFLEQVYANDLTLLLPPANLEVSIRGILKIYNCIITVNVGFTQPHKKHKKEFIFVDFLFMFSLTRHF